MRWLYLVLLKNPKKLFVKGAQNIFVQLYYRYKYNKNISNWLDSFLDLKMNLTNLIYSYYIYNDNKVEQIYFEHL